MQRSRVGAWLDPVKKVLTARPVGNARRVDSVGLDVWAWTAGERRLAPLGRRWVHSQGVGQRAVEVAEALALGWRDREVLVARNSGSVTSRRHQAIERTRAAHSKGSNSRPGR
jgi:hypothetical protein